MAARDPKKPVIIDLEDDDSVSLIPWEFVVDKCDGIVGGGITPNIQNINIDLARINNRIQQWIDAQRGNPQSTSEDFKATEYEDVFNDLIDVVYAQRQLIHTMANLLEQLNLGGGSAVLTEKTITENGTYLASDDGADGYSRVIVNVAGGGGSPSTITEYQPGMEYIKYQTVIDSETLTSYVVTENYTSETIEIDVEHEKLQLLGSDSRLVVFDHPPTQSEINDLPENVVVVEYDPNDTPYAGLVLNDNNR